MTAYFRRLGTLVVLAISLGALGCSKEEVVHGLNEFEANQIVSVLEHKNIKAMKEKEEGGRIITYKVIVPGADAMDARKVLVDNRLPSARAEGLMKIYDPANRGLIPTATEEVAAYQMALQGEIVEKLKMLPGVVQAHVTINKPPKDIVGSLEGKVNPATAAVVITYNMVDNKPPFKVEDVQRLVAHCVEGMDPANVTVVAAINRPAVIKQAEDEDGDGGTTVGAGCPNRIIGFDVCEETGKKKLTNILILGGAFSALVLFAFLLAIGGFMTQRSKVKQLNAQMVSLRKRNEAAPPPPA